MPVQQIQKEGRWTVEELTSLVPQQLLHGIPNPAPPPPDLDIPGKQVTPARG